MIDLQAVEGINAIEKDKTNKREGKIERWGENVHRFTTTLGGGKRRRGGSSGGEGGKGYEVIKEGLPFQTKLGGSVLYVGRE